LITSSKKNSFAIYYDAFLKTQLNEFHWLTFVLFELNTEQLIGNFSKFLIHRQIIN
jgi:hypothetical protein